MNLATSLWHSPIVSHMTVSVKRVSVYIFRVGNPRSPANTGNSAPKRQKLPFSRYTVSCIVHRACLRAQLDPVRAHRLRHTAATEMLRAGGSLPEVAQVLRHRKLETTGIYAKVDRRALRALARPWPGGAS